MILFCKRPKVITSKIENGPYFISCQNDLTYVRIVVIQFIQWKDRQIFDFVLRLLFLNFKLRFK